MSLIAELEAKGRHIVRGAHERWYLERAPESVPEGFILVHNRVQWQRKLSTRGFRAWLERAGSTESRTVPCSCGWTALEHYGVP
jgi:hypothetical protein